MIYPVPKPEKKPKTGLRSNPYKPTARRQERELAKEIGGKRVPLSGGGSIKGDVLSPEILAECKTSHLLDSKGNKQIIFKKLWLTKMLAEAKLEGKSIVFLQFRFKGDKSAWVVADSADYVDLVNEVQAYRIQEKERA